MKYSDVKTYVKGVITGYVPNKPILSQLGDQDNYLTYKGRIIDPSVSGTKLSLTNRDGWTSRSIVVDSEMILHLTWSFKEDNVPTGDGTLVAKVNNTVVKNMNVSQGNVDIDISSNLSLGTNTVVVTITDAYSNTKSLTLTIESVSLSISSTFNDSAFYDGDILFAYTPFGSAVKNIHIKVDGTEVHTEETALSNRQLTYTIDALPYGSHTLEAYFTSILEGATVESNKLFYEFISTNEEGNASPPVIITDFHSASVVQYTNIPIGFSVYTPGTTSSNVSISVNGDTVSTQAVNRERQTYVFKPTIVGTNTITITSGSVTKTMTFTVVDSGINVVAETNQLKLHLTSEGRSNQETNRNIWADSGNNVTCTLSNFNYVNNGWIIDDDGITTLRISNGARVTIPYKFFGTDFLNLGKTIEFEFAVRYVTDMNTTIMSCINNGIGITATPQLITLTSEQSQIKAQFKEDEHVRISFVVEKSATESHLIYCYINGIGSAVVQYPLTDSFEQATPVDFVIGSDYCTVDLYNIRVYDNDLHSKIIVDNWIADTQDLDTMLYRYRHNDIYNEYGSISLEKLPDNLPYLVMQAEELPTYKGDKKKISGYFVDPTGVHPNFSFVDAEYDVQGTSSQYYARKNFKAKYKNGFILEDDTVVSKYALMPGAKPVSTFCYKVDVASSEGTNNAELVKLFDDITPYKTPPQKEDDSVRQGVDGFPFVLFYDDLSGIGPQFYGKANFLNDKGTGNVFGFQEGDESWEIKNNTDDLSLFRGNDFETTYVNEKGETVYRWEDAFEGRYPDKSKEITNLKALLTWTKSTDTEAATDDPLSESVTYDGVEYTTDSKEYRLAKFKNEFSDHFEMQAMLFFYIFTETFLMIDNRAKNMFPTFFGDDKFMSLPYDFDTALGINNEGALVFSYNLEDIDKQPSGADVYNGQQSVLWKNFRACFYSEISDMYKTLRTKPAFSYTGVETRFENHQKVWPEAIFNEDAQFKYIDPLVVGTPNSEGVITKTDIYLDMLQGSKAEQRKWWLYNRFKYLDSKYVAGEAASDVITLRGYAKDDITVTPFNDIYVDIKYGSALKQERGATNVPTTIPCPLDEVNDTEIYIYSASQIKSVSDITGLKVGYADFSMATKLQTLTVHDDSKSPNLNMTNLGLGNNTLLKTVVCRDCPNLTRPVDLSRCTSIQSADFGNTAITGVQLANGSAIQTLILPDTITNLTLRNTVNLQTLTIGDNTDYSSIGTLHIENVDMIVKDQTTLFEILGDMADNSRIRLIGVEISVSSVDDLEDIKKVFDRFRGINDSGVNVNTAQVTGVVHVPGKISYGSLGSFAEDYPYLEIDADLILKATDGMLEYVADTIPYDIPEFSMDISDGHIYMDGVDTLFTSGENNDGHLVINLADTE